MRLFLALSCCSVILLLAGGFCHSRSGFALMGIAPVLVLDRYFFRLLPWRRPVRRGLEWFIALALAVAGASVAYVVRLGLVPIGEAVTSGMVLSLSVLSFASAQELLLGMFPWFQSPASGKRRCVEFALTATGVAAITVLAIALEPLHPLRTTPKGTPGVVGLAYENIWFTSEDGVRLAGWLVPHERARGNVIFCHGHGRNREQGRGLLQTFHQLGLNALAFDFRGHGDSAGHTATFGYREVRDLVAAADFMTRRFPNQPLFIVGISYGAAVALQALPRLPNMRAVWTEGCFSRLTPVLENELALVPGRLRSRLVPLCEALAWLDCGFQISNICPIEQIKNTDVPICFCHGTQDQLVPFAEGKALYDAYRGRKEHYWVDRATHYDIRRYHKDEYTRRMRDFFNSCLSCEQCCPASR